MSTNKRKSDSDSYGESAVLTELLGNSPEIKTLAVLLKTGRDISVSELAQMGGMSRSSVYEQIDTLRTMGFVEKTREIGGSPLYQINADSPVVQKLGELEYELIHALTEDDDDDFEIPESPPDM